MNVFRLHSLLNKPVEKHQMVSEELWILSPNTFISVALYLLVQNTWWKRRSIL